MTDAGINQKQILTVLFTKDTIDIRKIFAIIHRRRWLILGVSGAIVSLAISMTMMAKPKYQGSMQVMVSANSYQKQENKEGENIEEKQPDEEDYLIDYTSQQKLMTSSKLMNKLVDLLRSQYPDITVEEIKGKLGDRSFNIPLAVTPIPVKDRGNNQVASQVFEVSFRGENPVKVKNILSGMAQVYKDYNLEQQKQRLAQGLTLVNHLLPKIKQDLKLAEVKLAKFRQRNNFLDPTIQSKILLESLANVENKLQTTRAEIKDLQARQNHLQKKLSDSAPNAVISFRLSKSPRYQNLLTEIQKTETSLAEERKRYTDDAPSVKELLQKSRSQKNLLRQEMEKELGKSTTKTIGDSKSFFKQESLGEVELNLMQELSQVQTKISGLRANENSLMASAKKINTELNKYPQLVAEYNRLLPEVETHRKTLETTLQRQQSLALQAAQSGFDWQIVEEPQQIVAMGNGKLLNLLSGVLVAPILGIVVALSWELFDDVIYSVQDLRKLKQLRILGTVNKVPGPNQQKKTLFLPWGQTNNRAAVPTDFAPLPNHESLDMVYQNIQLVNSTLPFKSLMLTSAKSGEGKSTLALGLAVSAARMHQRVLVIDVNLRNPHLHDALNLTNDAGISLLLLEDNNAGFKDYIQPVHPAIDILTAGVVAEDPVKLLSSQRMKELIEFFEHHYDLVLIDAPSMLGTVDARIIASVCDRIAIVGCMGKLTKTELAQATEILNDVNLMGIIANQPHV
ncbi:MAG: polysaccharide biosynthesis tyrosine autokinase [Calothrix sp. MO_167.B42]|nr:polysaccharide biosynthesis tyrosine autokinase [Calothrix sp. MO_167.B42]